MLTFETVIIFYSPYYNGTMNDLLYHKPENKSNAVAVLTKTGGGDTIHIEIMQRSDIYEKESFSDSFVNGNGGLHDCLR